MSGALKCIVIKKEHERGREAETMLCPRLDETGAVKTIILSDDTAAKREVICCVREMEAKGGGRGLDVVDGWIASR